LNTDSTKKLSDLIESAIPHAHSLELAIAPGTFVDYDDDGKPCSVCLMTACAVALGEPIHDDEDHIHSWVPYTLLKHGYNILVTVNVPGVRAMWLFDAVLHLYDTRGYSPEDVIAWLRERGL